MTLTDGRYQSKTKSSGGHSAAWRADESAQQAQPKPGYEIVRVLMGKGRARIGRLSKGATSTL